jgi:acetate kinase
MRVLVLNAGSSSVKFSVFDMDSGEQCFESEIERVTHIDDALAKIPAALEKAGQHKFDAVGHRTPHGGEKFKDACLITDAVVADIEACVPLAPMHNPAALAGIAMARKVWPVPQVAVFDTAFHQTMPAHSYTYAVPEAWRKTGLRRYGFHGMSHQYIMERVAEELKTPASKLRIISCHIGNGASVCAIEHGKSVDTSMGMTPLEGLVMGTRSGDVDPGIFNYLNRVLGLSVADIEHALYVDSGLAALSGIGNDVRNIEKQALAGNAKAQLALEVYGYRVKKYIGAYAAAMGGADAICLTGGIGENSAEMRERICTGLEFLGFNFDAARNAKIKLTGFEAPQLQTSDSRIKLLVTKTREQWMIAKQVNGLISKTH